MASRGQPQRARIANSLVVAIFATLPNLAAADTRKPTTLRVGAAAPIFELPVVQGSGSGTLSDHLGRVVIVKFWATYCGWCKSIRPKLVKFARQHRKTASLLGISSQGAAKLKRYLRRHKLGFPILHDNRARVARRYRARATPTLIVVDQCGVARFHGSGTTAAKPALAMATSLMRAATITGSRLAACVESHR